MIFLTCYTMNLADLVSVGALFDVSFIQNCKTASTKNVVIKLLKQLCTFPWLRISLTFIFKPSIKTAGLQESRNASERANVMYVLYIYKIYFHYFSGVNTHIFVKCFQTLKYVILNATFQL